MIGLNSYPTKYDTVLILCRAFSVQFGSAKLTPPAAAASA